MTSNEVKIVREIDVEIARLLAIRDCSVARDMLPSISVLVEFLRRLGVEVIMEKKDEEE